MDTAVQPDPQQTHRLARDNPRMSATATTEPVRVLVVDDEPNIVDVISMALRFEGFEVESAATGADAIASVAARRPQLLVLDVMLPDIDGFEVARRLATARTDVPIIFLTARDSTEDVVHGLTVGGDDYVTKPFSLEELVARIRTILRRSGLSDETSSTLVFGDLELDEDTHEVARSGRPIDLTDTEFRLLLALAAARGRVLSRNQLMDQALGLETVVSDRTIDVHLTALRKKLGEARDLIKTVRGVGYRLADDGSPSN